MRKEVILAILIGLVMGLFITYGVYQARQSQEETAATDVAELEVTPAPTKTEEHPGKLTVYHPTDESILSEYKTTVTGETIGQAQIVIYINNTPIITQADESGSFSQEVELEELSNVITVYSVTQDGEIYQIRKTVIVHPEELNSEQATSSDQTQAEENQEEEN